MSEPFLAEVRIMGFNFPPRGWAQCDGQILPINQNQSLYSLLGTTYGGDGRTSFALPDLRGRAPTGPGNSNDGTNFSHGEKSGEENHMLVAAEMPSHTHSMSTETGAAVSPMPAATTTLGSFAGGYGAAGTVTSLAAGSIALAGGGQSHTNMQPYQALNFCIAIQGLFPSRN